jgi:hypothetical protein
LRGASEGILLMWYRRVVEMIEDYTRRFSFVCSFRSLSNNFEWAFVGVYGRNDDNDRKVLWDELAGLMRWWEMPWCIGEILMLFDIWVRN